MIPPKSDLRWKRLVTGQINHQFETVSAAMLVSRLIRVTGNGKSFEQIQPSIDEAHAFFSKYERILHDDISVIFGQGGVS